MVFGVVPGGGGNRRPNGKVQVGKDHQDKVVCLGDTSVYCACLSVMLSENVLCFMYFLSPPGVYVGTLNLIASIPGSSILT